MWKTLHQKGFTYLKLHRVHLERRQWIQNVFPLGVFIVGKVPFSNRMRFISLKRLHVTRCWCTTVVLNLLLLWTAWMTHGWSVAGSAGLAPESWPGQCCLNPVLHCLDQAWHAPTLPRTVPPHVPRLGTELLQPSPQESGNLTAGEWALKLPLHHCCQIFGPMGSPVAGWQLCRPEIEHPWFRLFPFFPRGLFRSLKPQDFFSAKRLPALLHTAVITCRNSADCSVATYNYCNDRDFEFVVMMNLGHD